ncbi:hypothetical protein SLS60_002309 [Paraconiothyrium brasiliense]|uniref:Leucine-rich repeat domain-containing protein n=1 Tax=Paraconiothyrium brasiliense TaxID=300254 RepID=A0ABR3S1S7_9PLEO
MDSFDVLEEFEDAVLVRQQAVKTVHGLLALPSDSLNREEVQTEDAFARGICDEQSQDLYTRTTPADPLCHSDSIETKRQHNSRQPITKLPAELQFMILKQGELSRTDCYNICLSVRHFTATAQQHLHEKVNLGSRNIYAFTRTMLCNQDLRSRVRVADIQEQRYDVLSPRARAQFQFCVEESQRLGLHLPYRISSSASFQDMLQDCYKNHWGRIIIAMLLSILPSLERASIPSSAMRKFAGFAGSQNTRWSSVFFQEMIPFDKLKKVLVSGRRRNIGMLAPLFKLPALNTLLATEFEEPRPRCSWNWDEKGFGADRASPITTLDLYGGELHNDAISFLIERSRALFGLALDLCRMAPDGEVQGRLDDRYNLAPIKRALLIHKNTLECLSIDETYIHSESHHWSPIGSLTEFTRLQRLCVASEVIYHPGHGMSGPEPRLCDLLPSTLQELDISCAVDNEFFEDDVYPRFAATRKALTYHGLLPDKEQSKRFFPNLTCLRLEHDNGRYEDLEDDDVDDLVETFAQHEIHFYPYHVVQGYGDYNNWWGSRLRYSGQMLERRPLMRITAE